MYTENTLIYIIVQMIARYKNYIQCRYLYSVRIEKVIRAK
jgi:hypothetical protein